MSIVSNPTDQVPFKKSSTPQSGWLEPLSSSERIALLSHYYRGELARMTSWRDRIDRTSNWALTVVAALLSVSLSAPASHHGVVLFGVLLVSLMLYIEARRYRFFDLYRARVREMERNYFAPLLDPAGQFGQDWSSWIAQSLRAPDFLISQREAMARRLKRNYGWMFLILGLAWLLKISSPRLTEEGMPIDRVDSLAEFAANAALGPVPGWPVLIAMALFASVVLVAALRPEAPDGAFAYGDAHV